MKIIIFWDVMMCDLVKSNCIFLKIPCLPCRGGRSSFKMPISLHQTEWHHVPQDSNLHNYHRNLKPHMLHVLGKFFWPHYDPKADSASNRNEYKEYFLGVKAASV